MLAERLSAQLLAGRPARDPVAVVERLLAVQAQDPRGMRLAIRARTRGVTAADLDRALTEDRSLVVTWLNRGTLHLVRREDYPWLHALTASDRHAMKRLPELGVPDPEKALRALERKLADGPVLRAEAGEGQVAIHLLALACARGIAVRGPVVDGEQAYVLVRDWLGEQPAVDREVALGELAQRYLEGHGPADDRDLAKWAGLPLRDARAGLARVRAPRRRAAAAPPPRLLGPFDPVLLGWASRDHIPGEERVVAGGIFRAFALAGGRAVATWGIRAGRVVIEPFGRLPRAVSDALDQEAASVLRFLG